MINCHKKSAEEVLPLDARWYEKSALLVDNFNKVPQRLCRRPRFVVSIDEIMEKFKGR